VLFEAYLQGDSIPNQWEQRKRLVHLIETLNVLPNTVARSWETECQSAHPYNTVVGHGHQELFAAPVVALLATFPPIDDRPNDLDALRVGLLCQSSECVGNELCCVSDPNRCYLYGVDGVSL